MSDIKFIEGGIFTDYRGQISHVNDLDMQEIKRFYIIHQKDTSIIRAWHAHQHEKKWFYVVKGSFTTAFANGIKANEPDSTLLVYSDKILSDAVHDSWRYDKDMWMDWNLW